MDVLETVQIRYPVINKAAGEFLLKLSLTGLTKDIMLAAEMAGLLMLRESSANIQKIKPGTCILGAISDEAYNIMHRFLYGWAVSNGLNPKAINIEGIPADAKAYLPELSRFEQPFYEICQVHGIEYDHFPFVAATSAMKLVAAGEKLRRLDPGIGQAMVHYHVIAGSKTVPYPPAVQATKPPASGVIL
jgi:hypothetical protein